MRPESAAYILAPSLHEIYIGGHTGLVDLWIFNASVSQPTSAVGSQLQQAFIASVTVAGLMTPADGKPSYILRLDGSSSYVSAGGYVAANVTGASSPAVATKTLAAYGFNVASVIQYSRVQYSSMLAAQPTYDKLKFGKKYVLGEAIAGLGVSNAFDMCRTELTHRLELPAPVLVVPSQHGDHPTR